MAKLKIEDMDLYAILNVSIESTDKEIVKAYRKKALQCHPDKNPDNPKAAEEFHQLSKALEILTDAAARAAYDKTLRAKQAATIRHRVLDSKRRKLKEDLESREKAAQEQKAEVVKVARSLHEEIERLRKEGSRLVEDEQARLTQELKREREKTAQKCEAAQEYLESAVAPRLRVKWKAQKGDLDNGGYTQDSLMKLFSKHGEVIAVLISTKKAGNAVVEFESVHSAILAVQHEIGLTSNPLTLTWLSGEPAQAPTECSRAPDRKRAMEESSAPTEENLDFESLVMYRMRQAEERKRLIEQMKNEDSNT